MPDTEAKLIAHGQYSLQSGDFQTFPVLPEHNIANNNALYRFFQLRIGSNHGNQMYTCLYRFMLHAEENGDPQAASN